MEIATLPKNGLKIRGKQTSLLINASDKSVVFNGIILLGRQYDKTLKEKSDVVVIDGPGDYEVGGIKITGQRGASGTVYSLTVDGVDILLGEIADLEKMHQKLKEHNLVIVVIEEVIDSSFATTLASHSVLFFGDKAKEVANAFAKDSVKEMSKYQITKDKLPQEMETVLLASI